VTRLSQRERELLEKREHLDPDDEDDREQLRLYDAELFASSALFSEDPIHEGAEPRPAWLDNLHRELHAAVAAAYGWPANLSDDEILKRLFELNQERAGIARPGGAAETLRPIEATPVSAVPTVPSPLVREVGPCRARGLRAHQITGTP
jgi:hypothetical protein